MYIYQCDVYESRQATRHAIPSILDRAGSNSAQASSPPTTTQTEPELAQLSIWAPAISVPNLFALPYTPKSGY